MNTYFISDLHFDHANIIRLCNRPFTDLNHMTETIIQNWQAIVRDDDLVYVLGDFAFNYQNVPKYLSRLPGKKRLVIGNHEKKLFQEVWKLSNTVDKYYKFYLDAGFEQIDTTGSIMIGTIPVLLSHFPYRVDNPEPTYDDRYRAMRLIDSGLFLIHGHRHDKAPFYNGARQFNVSVEVTNYTPVSLDIIRRIITDDSSTIVPNLTKLY